MKQAAARQRRVESARRLGPRGPKPEGQGKNQRWIAYQTFPGVPPSVPDPDTAERRSDDPGEVSFGASTVVATRGRSLGPLRSSDDSVLTRAKPGKYCSRRRTRHWSKPCSPSTAKRMSAPGSQP